MLRDITVTSAPIVSCRHLLHVVRIPPVGVPANNIINLAINSGDAKAVVRHLWKASSFKSNITTKFNGNQPVTIVQWNCRRLRSYDRIKYL
jgi:hypothetical protein